MSQLIKTIMILLLASQFSGCAYQSVQPNPAYAPVRPPLPMSPPKDDGSIFSSATSIAFFETDKATRVGDILTVVFDERHVSKKETKTEDKKGSNTSLTGPTVFGNVANATTGLQPPWLKALNMNVSSSADFAGNGKSEQKDSLSGSLSVTVVEVLSNNNLIVRGEKLLTLNQGDEYVQLSGVVRRRDIGPDNKVFSSKIANARITYSGRGVTHESNRPGWLSRFFMSDKAPF